MRKVFIYAIILFQIILITSLIRNIQLSIRARYRVRDLQAQKERLAADHAKLQDELVYVQSDLYAEKVARDELQLGREGETVVIMPENLGEITSQQDSVQEVSLPNYLKWWKVLSGQE